MATYDLTSSLPVASSLVAGDILNCPYSGTYKTIELPKGTYQLQCWGARGGRGPGSNGANVSGNANYGRGGYSIGTIKLPRQTTVYLYAGGAGADATGINATAYAGGWNGGGNGGALASTSSATNGSGGGGASDIRIGSTSLYARVIVAGGGGGASWYTNTYTSPLGGAGGGTSGVAASLGGSSNSSYYTAAQPGTATSGGAGGQVSSSTYGTVGNAGSFGNGGSGPSNSSSIINSGAGGGGGWYGGGSGFAAKGGAQGHGAGGSGYVYTLSTSSNYPEGCLLNSNYYLSDASTVAGDSSIIDPESGSSVTGRSGHGYIRITVIKVSSGSTFIKINSTTWKNYKNIFIKTPAILPSEYTQLEYIKCEGAQYINTGFIPTGNTRLILDFQLDRKDGQALFCGGRTAASGSDPVSYTAFFGNSAGTIRRDYYGASKTTTKSWNAGDRIVFDANKNITTINGDSTLLSNFTLNTSSTSIMPIVLFTTCYQASSDSSITLSNSNWAYYKVFSCKIYDNNTLARNFLPAKNSSGTIGLYDTVTSKFYTNAGTGTFTTGPNANPWKQIKYVWAKTAADTWSQTL